MHTIIIFLKYYLTKYFEIFLTPCTIIWILHLYVTDQPTLIYVVNSDVMHRSVSEKFLFSGKRDAKYIHISSKF